MLKVLGTLGIWVPLAGCADEPEPSNVEEKGGSPFGGTVAVIGAGAAGMSAGLVLAQNGIEFSILEAAPTYGGRIKRADGFVDFPIPLGGEWLHENREELTRMVNDDAVVVDTEVVGYDESTTTGYFDAGTLELGLWGEDPDLKLVGVTWLDFFDKFIIPTVEQQMIFNTQIIEVDYSGEDVVLTSADGQQFVADRVVVTAPLRALQDEQIRFVPELPVRKRIALRDAEVWNGFKAFFEFTEAFYPTFVEFADSDNRAGQRLYYDAAYGQDTNANVLGLFSVGKPSAPYSERSGDELRDHILAELDQVFDGAASRTYVQHLAQDWSKEPYIEQAYISDFVAPWIPRDLWTPVENRVFFAGEAYTNHDDWGAVDDAARSAREAVMALLG